MIWFNSLLSIIQWKDRRELFYSGLESRQLAFWDEGSPKLDSERWVKITWKLVGKCQVIDRQRLEQGGPFLWMAFVQYKKVREKKVQFSRSVISDSATPWTAACQTSLSITNSQSFLRLMSIESVMPSSHLILCHPLLLPPSIFSSIRVFSSESFLHIRWPKHWSFSFSFLHSNECSVLISFRMDWFHLLAVQGTLKSLKIPISLKSHKIPYISVLRSLDFIMKAVGVIIRFWSKEKTWLDLHFRKLTLAAV